MNLVVSVDKNWAIGSNNRLLVKIPFDMKLFKNLTIGKVVIMGINTLKSLPNGEPLKNRTNIVITSNPDFKKNNCLVVNNIDTLLKIISKYNTNDIYVIGGASIYNQLINYCDTAYVTYINHEFNNADTFIKNIDELDQWQLILESNGYSYRDITYTFRIYKNQERSIYKNEN